MSIKEFLVNPYKENRYASSFKRATASMIDLWIVLFLRILTMEILGRIWLKGEIVNFVKEFYDRFGTETPKNTPEHIDFIINSRVFFYVIIFYLVIILIGALYHALLNSSNWNGTVGKRLMKIIIVKEYDELKISFLRGLLHYFLSILPFAFIIYLVIYQKINHLTFYQAITTSELNVFLGIIFVFWTQIHLFTKKKNTAYDMICETILINGKTESKLPWKKPIQTNFL
jgi:uncharacterized RDD family membrane protein YckC